MTHYKWYDYKHAHTTYRKQLTNNTKQTDKTKKRKKRETNTNKNAFVPFKGEVFHESALRTIRVLSNTEPDVSLVTITCWIPVGDTFGG